MGLLLRQQDQQIKTIYYYLLFGKIRKIYNIYSILPAGAAEPEKDSPPTGIVTVDG